MKEAAFWILCCCAFFLSSCVSVSSKKTEKKNQLRYNLALSLIKECKYRLALQELQQIVQVEKTNPVVFHSLALVYFQLKQYDQAIQFLQKSLELNPQFTVARVNLGRSLIEVEKLERGLNLLKQAEKDLTYPYPENIHNHMALAYFKKKDFKLAEKHFRVSRKVKTQDCVTSLYHARSLYFLKRFSEALDILKQSKNWCEAYVPCSSPHFEAYFFLALVYNKLNKEREAIFNMNVFLNKAEKESPYYTEARNFLNLWRK